ncbi:molybdate ABC transporter substrate-binding protein [Oceanobacillus alkalisoli]|uniref:molybdate ABC transporter substrate-binding protein n=1 Tax=Oceanobacillus alkalisoli TaxID=2925113 RepID=UPI001EEF9044|nr:molybdate ABC transporter substrate-binding protein [Oceanobacillus alkalisoli]MCF3942916.1 molybdate ABC transporter substrate-binding protein [Oceanobacillus alkalisoli]MCG5102343.1 molybdate ABC transporter substrate-binding protein [Oceanobacillus alkalisoli]
MRKQFHFICILLFLLLSLVACSDTSNSAQDSADKQSASGEDTELTISAAASLKEALDSIQEAFLEEHPEVALTFNYGASGSLQQQISQGAPVDLFFSAAKDKFNILVEEGMIAEESQVDLLGNELVLIVPKGEQTINGFADLQKAEIGNISIGIPKTVPAGKYAQELLVEMDLWDEIESKIVFAKDVRQVLSYVETGNVDAGIVYQTDALTSEKINIAAPATNELHTPILYPVGIIKDSDQYEMAKVFLEYIQSDEIIKVFEEYGFTVK